MSQMTHDPIPVIRAALATTTDPHDIVRALTNAGFVIARQLAPGEIGVTVSLDDSSRLRTTYRTSVSFDGGLNATWAAQTVRGDFMRRVNPGEYQHELATWLSGQLAKSLAATLVWAVYPPVAAAVREVETAAAKKGVA